MSIKVVSILAIVTTLCAVALVTLQILEFMYYSSEPSVWPLVQ
jgi:hypothetical protein